MAAFSNGQTVNYTNISREIGVSANTVRGYFDVLVDTLVAAWLPAWNKRAKRRTVESPRFYFFDTGTVSELTGRGRMTPGSREFGQAFEHLLFMELRACSGYQGGWPLAYWRTTSGLEVDFILGDGCAAVEVKSTESITPLHLRGLRAWRQEHPGTRCILVCRSPRPRLTEDNIEILPWRDFLAALWNGAIAVG